MLSGGGNHDLVVKSPGQNILAYWKAAFYCYYLSRVTMILELKWNLFRESDYIKG